MTQLSARLSFYGSSIKQVAASHRSSLKPPVRVPVKVPIKFLLPILVFALLSFLAQPSNAQTFGCTPTMSNDIVCENSKPGTPASTWDITGAGDSTIQGFATDISVNQGGTISFKINTPAKAYTITIFRMGYYGGNGARQIASVSPSATLPQTQPACKTDSTTFLYDCGNWGVSASWQVPSNATSGIYFALITRTDTGGSNHIVFVVRNDASHSDVLFQTNDETWQAYNAYGGHSVYGQLDTWDLPNRAYKVSYNRPFITRGFSSESATWVFGAEYPMVRWLEANGYDVTYYTGMDAARSGGLLLNHKIYMDSGHDEYVSGPQRTSIEAARNGGVNLAFFSGNEVFWKTRWENSIDGTSTPNRTMVVYKETLAFAKIDPTSTWTGTWRDPSFSPPSDGGRPENSLTGTIFMVNGPGADNPGNLSIKVPAADGKMRFWRNTTIANLASGQTATLPIGTLGYEWDEDLDNGSRPAGLFDLSTATYPLTADLLLDYGATYGAGNATHHMTMYRAPSGALVFGAGTVQWSWGLDSNHDNAFFSPNQPASLDMQQATVNLFGDMGIQPATLQGGLLIGAKSTDTTPPTSTITSPITGSTVTAGSPITITGTSTDTGGGVVAGVEVSVDGGTTWHPATGRGSWSYTWTTLPFGTSTIRSRAVDDSGNLETPSAGVSVTVTCPCTIWNSSGTPTFVDSADSNATSLGVKFRTDVSGFITGIRFYKATANTGTHIGNIWTGTGTLLGSATFTAETASGWQQVNFSSPIAVSANTTYVASYFAPKGHYSQDEAFFATKGVDIAPLHLLAAGVDGPNGVYLYTASNSFPTSTYNSEYYWIDIIFSTKPGPPWTISGTISPSSLGSGTVVTLSGTTSGTVTADASGNYSFGGLANGSYTVTPAKTGLTFSPANQPVTVNGANASGVNFAVQTWTISGTVGTGSATVALSGTSSATTTADSSGNYSFTGLVNGSYTITPSKTGFTFTPASQTVPVSGVNVSAVNFTATAVPTYSISGTVSGAVVSGVSIALTGTSSGTTTTDATGNYSFTGLSNGSYTVTPNKTGYTFTPANQPVTVSNANVPATNFTAQVVVQPAGLAVDASVSVLGAQASSVTSPALSTKFTNELVLAFIATDYLGGTNTTITGVTGGGLTWVLVLRTNAQSGSAEVWRAFAPTPLSNVAVTATLSQSVVSSITVLSFSGADTTGTNGSGAIGATKSGSAGSGAPTVGLTTTRNNSWVFAVGNDFDNAVAHTPGASQALVQQYLTAAGDTYWVQKQNTTTPLSGTSVTINDTAPTGDRYNLTAVEVLPSIAPPPPTYSISGTVSGAIASGVTINLTGTSTGTTTTDSSGNYTFAGLSNGSYTVTPSKTGYTFTPANLSVTVSGNNVPAQNFTSVAYSISGTVSGAIASGVTINLTGTSTGTATTDSSGNYTFAGLSNGSYTVTPNKTGYTFTPANLSVTVSGNNVPAQNFTSVSVPTYSISGTVSGAIAAGVTMSLTGASTGSTTTDASGNYSFTGLSNGSYTVAPSKAGYTFTPSSQGVSVSGSNATSVSFTSAVAATWSISGTLSPSSLTSGATVALSGAATATTTADASGNYMFSNLQTGGYTVTPTKAGATFTPANQTLQLNVGNATGVNFTAQAVTAPGKLALDANVSTNGVQATTVTSPAFSTTSTNELLLAFIATDFLGGANTTVTGVSGGGLPWTLVSRANGQSGTSEIWRAFSPAALSNVSVTATVSQSVVSSITVMTFTGADATGTNGSAAIGASQTASATAGAPTATLVTTRNGSWVFGVGNDYDNAIGRTAGASQTVVQQFLTPTGDTYWVQMQNAATPTSGTSVSINDTAPVGDRYNLAIVEVLPGTVTSGTPPSVTMTSPAPAGTVATLATISANATDANYAITGVQFLLDGSNLGPRVNSPPYSMTWDSAAATTGSHTFSAIAYNSAGLNSTATPVTITVDHSGNAAVVGSWSSVYSLSTVAMNLILLKNGELMFYEDGGSATVWDYVNNVFTGVPISVNLFCSGFASMADGRILVVGGYGGSGNLQGIANAEIFDPSNNTWTAVPNMSYRRWYPNAATLSDGRILVTAGWQTTSHTNAGIPEIYNPSSNQWTQLTNANNPFETYPFMFVLPNGQVIHVGGSEYATNTDMLNVATQTWSVVDSRIIDGGAASMYLPGKIMKAGSATDSQGTGPSSNTTFVLDTTQPTPAWQQVPSMAYPRSFINLTTLPDGSVLATGGETDKNGGTIANAVYAAELWSPQTQTWTTLSSMKTPREYHSTALLLPDARVVVSGMGNDFGQVPDETNAEIFSPPYLFKGARPAISQAPAQVQYGANFSITTPDFASISKVVLIRTGATTHFFDQSTHYVPLTFTQTSGGLTVTGPVDGNTAPPGYYMLFLVNSSGVPSVAKIVQVP